MTKNAKIIINNTFFSRGGFCMGFFDSLGLSDFFSKGWGSSSGNQSDNNNNKPISRCSDCRDLKLNINFGNINCNSRNCIVQDGGYCRRKGQNVGDNERCTLTSSYGIGYCPKLDKIVDSSLLNCHYGQSK